MKPLRKIDNKLTLFRPLLDVRKNFLIRISKNTFGKYVKDPSNKDEKYLRTKIRNLKKPLENSGVKYEQIFKSIQNLSFSRSTLDNYFEKIFKKLINVRNNQVKINLKKFNKLNNDVKIALINQSIKKIKKNYYDLRSRKVENLIKNLSRDNFKKSTLGGCIFFKKDSNLCLKQEKL